MKTAEEMQAEGMTPEEIEKALTEQGMDEEAMAKALAELDDLEKGEDDGIDDLLKAIEEQESELAKSGHDDDDDDEGDDDEDEDDEDFGKSLPDSELMDELVKASEAYEQLEESIHKSMGNLSMEIRTLQKSQFATMNLLIKTAKAIAGMQDEMKKSMEELGASPATPVKGILGRRTEEKLVKSRSEISEMIHKAVTDNRVDAKYLSVFAVRGADALPDFIKKEIGL